MRINLLNFATAERRFFWYLKVSKRVTQGTSFTSRVYNEKVAYELWSQPIKRLVDNFL